MAAQLYTMVYVLVNGKIMMEEASVTLNRDSGAQPVNTVGRGFAGVSLGAPQLTASVENAIPMSGFEYDAGQAIESLELIDFGLLCAGLALSTKGFILKDSVRHGVGQQSGYSFEFIGDFKQFE